MDSKWKHIAKVYFFELKKRGITKVIKHKCLAITKKSQYLNAHNSVINILIQYSNIKLIYKTNKQFWGITFEGLKKRLNKIFFYVLFRYKTLISYKQSLLNVSHLIKQNPLLKWVGSKRKKSLFICSKFPKILNNYHEIFLGSGSVLLQLLLEVKFGKIVILGDIFVSDFNPFLINFYKVIQSKLLIFIRFLKKFLYLYNNLTTIELKSNFYYKIRDKFNNLNCEFPSVKNAVFFFFLNKSCFRGLYRCNKKGEFNVPFGNYFLLNLNENDFIEFSMLIRNVFFNCCNYSETLCKFVKGDIVYLDPPYLGNNIFINYLKHGFDYLQFLQFLKKLQERKISYVLSNVLNSEILALFSSNIYKIFYFEIIEGMVNIKKKRIEVLITFL